MGEETPQLDELAARKRLVQAHMELHRAEMALHYQEVTAPFRLAQSKVSWITANPILRWLLIGTTSFVLVSKRTALLRRAASWAIPLLVPRLRGMFKSPTFQLGLKGAQFLLNRRG